jgi:hypothetical protein
MTFRGALCVEPATPDVLARGTALILVPSDGILLLLDVLATRGDGRVHGRMHLAGSSSHAHRPVTQGAHTHDGC